MASVSRTAQFAKVFKVLKKHYKPATPDLERPVLEHLLFACCLEDAHYQAAEEAFAALVHTFFDWNEVRVTTITELSEVMSCLPDPRAAANRLKRVLQAVFEATYAFDLEDRRKKNLGPTVKWLKKIDGTTNFSIAYVVQSALRGHAIPIDSGVLKALRVVELISDKDLEAGVVPGLERAISKAKGIEFGSMLHQFGADFTANPYSPEVRGILLQINPDCKDQLPKRRAGRKPREKPSQQPPQEAEAKSSATGRGRAAAGDKKEAAARKRASAAQEEPSSGATKKRAETRKKTAASLEKTAAEELSKRKPR